MRSSVFSNEFQIEVQVIEVLRSDANTLPMKMTAVSRRRTSPAVSLALVSLLTVSAQTLGNFILVATFP